jgi:hypothetical protein
LSAWQPSSRRKKTEAVAEVLGVDNHIVWLRGYRQQVGLALHYALTKLEQRQGGATKHYSDTVHYCSIKKFL